MVKAHREDHREAKTTVARSRTLAWIVRATPLAKSVVAKCNFCKFKRKILREQKMGKLPSERVDVNCPPWTSISLDLTGPVKVKGMVNVRTTMKVWPIVFCCLSTGAIHVCLMHSYGTDAFLLQWENFTALRGHPKLVWSDKGS